MLADQTYDSYEALSRWLREQGYKISRNSLHKYGRRVQERVERAKERIEEKRLMILSLPKELDKQAAAVISMVFSELGDVMTLISNAGSEIDLEMRMRLITQAARAAAELTRACVEQKKLAEEVRAKIDEIAGVAQKAGKQIDLATLETIKDGVYGF